MRRLIAISAHRFGALLALLLAAALAAGLLALVGTKPAEAAFPATKDERPTFKPRAIEETVPDQIIVKFKGNVNSATRASARRAAGLEKKKDLELIDAEVDKVKGQSAEAAVRALERRSDVEYAELDYIYHPTGYADEPQFGQLWGLDNTGQSIGGISGTADVDINGKEASSVTQGDTNLVVAVIDDGVDFSHPDLQDRAWKNPGESGSGKETNGVDDDANGLVDDVNGWDFYYGDKTVHDSGEDFHGTHVSGTIAASVNNQGVVGVAPNVQIMALKFLGPQGGFTSDAIDALGYAKSKGAKISNNSWGCSPGFCFSQALKDAIEASGQLFVAAAGNSSNNNDVTPAYPASYDSPNILSVAAINNQGNLAGFSNYGATSVDISAPGVGILSSIPGISDTPAAALSSVGSSGKAITVGFGADEIGDTAKQASFMSKAFGAVNRGSESVVLVDDDADDSWLGFPDVAPTLTAAIESATGSPPEVIDVPYRSDGPALSQLTGKTVVWATGQAFLSDDDGFFITQTTLTNADQTTLTNFLNGGGKLVLTGMDALFLIEGSSFVTNTLKLNPQSNVPDKTAFNGSSGTAFDGESYVLNSSTALPDSHDVLTPADSAAVTQGVYPADTPPSWQSFSGTSMAAPHATGVAALAGSAFPNLLSNSTGLKQKVMDSGKSVPATSGKTVTGDMADAKEAIGLGDTTPPQTTITGGPNGTTTDATPTFSFSGSDNISPATNLLFSYKVDDGEWSTYSSETSATLGSLSNGNHTFYVKAKDEAGNEDQSPAERSFTVASALSLGANPATLTFGQSTTLSGKLINSNGAALANKRVILEQRPLGATSFIAVPKGNVITDSSGNFHLAGVKPTQNTDYRARFVGDGTNPAVISDLESVEVKVLLSLKVKTKDLTLGKSRTISGAVKPKHTDTGPVTISIERDGQPLETKTVNLSKSKYRLSYTPSEAGLYSIKASYSPPSGHEDHLGNETDTKSFRVVP